MVERMEELGEEFVPEDEAEAGPGALKKLREKLTKAVEEKQEYLESWQRARADLVNYKKEEATINADREDRLTAEYIETLLPALDTLELSLKHESSKTIEMIERQFIEALKKSKVERFGAVGETFDPHIHEALAHEADGQYIVRVERSGYKIGNRVIRPAQAII
jgi:molecular chaperone GrpE